ncbi:type VI immunity family protein, partial [Pyxidicoccus sp. 3LFB2]
MQIRNGLVIRFFIYRSHAEFAPGVLRALNAYRQAVGPEVLAWYPNMEGDWQRLDDTAWERTRQALLDEDTPPCVTLADRPDGAVDFQFEYEGISLESPGLFDDPRRACVVTFSLPTKFLEERGPGYVRELALKLASHLPYNSGYASLDLNTSGQFVGVTRPLHKLCFRYPGVDVLEYNVAWDIGTRVPGAYWLTFLGPPVLGELGGVEGLRARLSSPGTTVQPLEGERAVVTLGEWPEAGDLE